MTRALSSACIVLLSLVLAGRASAGSKPPIAILGLEVYDNGGGIDPDTTKAAKELTAALRDRAKAGTGPYVPVPGGDKELIDEKLLNNCDSEAAVCMAAIGTELGADVLMYGKIEKSSQNGQTLYKVSIKLLNVGRKQLANSTVETLPLADSTGLRAQAHAKSWYNKLAGISTGGTLTVHANVDSGTVLLDGAEKGTLTSGAVTLTGVAEGAHQLAIEAKDYQRYDARITIKSGDVLSHSALLVELSRPVVPSKEPVGPDNTVAPAPKSKTNVWKPIFIGTTVLEAGAIGFTIYEWQKGNGDANKIHDSMRFSGSDCGNNSIQPASMADKSNFKSACDAFKLQKIGWAATGVVSVAVIGTFIMAFVRDSGASSGTEAKASTGSHRKRRELAITPVVSPDGAGATLRFDW
jgi:hypothetical protein